MELSRVVRGLQSTAEMGKMRASAVWQWFRAESESTLQLDAQACCNEAGASQNEGEPPSTALKRWLERQEAMWLLVFDNAEDTEALRPHLPLRGHLRL